MISVLAKKLRIGLVFATMSLFASSTSADTIVLNFEGLIGTSAFTEVGDFYEGGQSGDGFTGPNLGVEFSDNALALFLNTLTDHRSNTSRGGLGDPNSQMGGLFFLSGDETFMNVAAGFDTGFSFNYSAISQPGSVSVYDDVNGSGNLLVTLNIPTTVSGPCIGYGAQFCPFFPIGVGFLGTAKSVSFAGVANQIVFDDITFGSVIPGQENGVVPEPATLALFGTGFAVAAARKWRRRQQSRVV